MNTKPLVVKVKISKLGQSEKDDEHTDEIHRLHGITADLESALEQFATIAEDLRR